MASSSLPLRFPRSLVQGRCSEKEPEWEERLPPLPSPGSLGSSQSSALASILLAFVLWFSLV